MCELNQKTIITGTDTKSTGTDVHTIDIFGMNWVESLGRSDNFEEQILICHLDGQTLGFDTFDVEFVRVGSNSKGLINGVHWFQSGSFTFLSTNFESDPSFAIPFFIFSVSFLKMKGQFFSVKTKCLSCLFIYSFHFDEFFKGSYRKISSQSACK